MENYPDVNHIDFMSVDVEGAELSILRTIDFTKYSFGLITVENNEPDDALTKYMQINDYEVFVKIGSDILFRRYQISLNI
jgi:hypothetical protein